MGTTRVSQRLSAPRARVYRALVDPEMFVRWRFPRGMTCRLDELDAAEHTFRVSLTYTDPTRRGKTAGNTDTYRGRFVRLVPDELVVEEDEFESTDAALRGVMTTTIRLTDDDGGTRLDVVHDGLPSAVRESDNAAGWRESLARLAALLDAPQTTAPG